jgi:uncharacterized membrane protein YagU involved in acid resistance
MNKISCASLAGLTATAPMTGVMLAVERVLCPTAKPLVNKQIVSNTAKKVSIAPLNRPTRNLVAWISHFAYGAATGTAYGVLPRPTQPARGAIQGAVYGLAVWAAGYLGWLPAAGILPPATRQPARRNVSLILSHLVWGATTAVIFDQLCRKRHGNEPTEN